MRHLNALTKELVAEEIQARRQIIYFQHEARVYELTKAKRCTLCNRSTEAPKRSLDLRQSQGERGPTRTRSTPPESSTTRKQSQEELRGSNNRAPAVEEIEQNLIRTTRRGM